MTRRALLALPLALVLPALAARADDPLPKAETVLDQFVEATGGKAAYEKLKNRVSKGTFELAQANIKGKAVMYQAPPNRAKIEIDLGDIGKSIEGSDGSVVWESNPFSGERLIEGEERADKLLHYTFNGEIKWREMYEKAECTGVEDVDGKPAYKVVLTPRPGQGKPVTEYYDKASHLQVKSIATTQGPMGEIRIEGYPSDYKKVDGVLVAYKLTQKLLTQTIVISMDEIKHNVDLPPNVFQVPAEIKALADKKKDAK